MELQGRIVDILPITSGTTKSGKNWKSQELALETSGQYSKTVAFTLFGDKCENHGLTIGQEVNIHFDVESRKYNDRYFTSVKAFKVEMLGYQTHAPAPAATSYQPPTTTFTDESDDLSF